MVARPSWPWARFTGETPVLRARPAKDHKKAVNHVRDLKDVIGREKSVSRRIITLREPTF